jgi:hypothetical protein
VAGYKERLVSWDRDAVSKQMVTSRIRSILGAKWRDRLSDTEVDEFVSSMIEMIDGLTGRNEYRSALEENARLEYERRVEHEATMRTLRNADPRLAWADAWIARVGDERADPREEEQRIRTIGVIASAALGRPVLEATDGAGSCTLPSSEFGNTSEPRASSGSPLSDPTNPGEAHVTAKPRSIRV